MSTFLYKMVKYEKCSKNFYGACLFFFLFAILQSKLVILFVYYIYLFQQTKPEKIITSNQIVDKEREREERFEF